MPRAADLPHPSFETVWPTLSTFRRPTGDFDPEGGWTHEYRIGAPVFSGEEFRHAPVGKLILERRPGPRSGDLVPFEVYARSQILLESSATVRSAKLRAPGDGLATPQAWEIEEQISDKEGELVSEHLEEGLGTEGTIPCWAIFEATQRLAPDATPEPFTLHEELRVLKPDQRLVPAGELAFARGCDELQLHGFRLVGAGHLPWHFWVDENSRLLFVLSPLKTFVWKA